MRMRRTTEMDLAPNGNVTLEHDGLHIMLMGLTSPLKSGDSFPLTLKFEKAGEVKVNVTVK
jgi:copper(I)-binding protein